jgi:hypothetical protein
MDDAGYSSIFFKVAQIIAALCSSVDRQEFAREGHFAALQQLDASSKQFDIFFAANFGANQGRKWKIVNSCLM